MLLLLAAATGGSLSAQVMQPDAPRVLDSTERRQQAALLSVRDSLTGLRGAMAEMQRDLAAASQAVVAGRAARLTASCARARTAARDARWAVCPRCGTPGQAAERRRMTLALDELALTMVRCTREFAVDTAVAELSRMPRSADSVRVWAPHRLSLLEAALKRYEGVLYHYTGAVKIPMTPNVPGARGRSP